jgi:hypothetical protein
MTPESKAPVSEVTVCSQPSWFFQQTVVPGATSTVGGSNPFGRWTSTRFAPSRHSAMNQEDGSVSTVTLPGHRVDASWYEYDPGASNVKKYVESGCISPESNSPVSETTLRVE